MQRYERHLGLRRGLRKWLGYRMWIALASLVFVTLGSGGVGLGSSGHGLAQPVELVIVHQNDVHGRLEPVLVDGEERGGLAGLAGIVETVRAQHPGAVLWLDGGDTLHGTLLANLFEGASVIEALNEVGLDAMVLGNHEFNFGQEVLAQRMQEAVFPVLSANTVTSSNGEPGDAAGQPTTTTGRSDAMGWETTTGSGNAASSEAPAFIYGDISMAPAAAFVPVAGLRVGILGLTTQGTSTSTHPSNVVGLEFLDPIDTAARWVPRIREQADLVIALTHIGYDLDRELAARVPGIDVIVGGHSHTELPQAERVGTTIIVQAGDHSRYLGVLRLVVNGGQIVEYASHLEPVTGASPRHAGVEAVIGRWQARMTDQLEEVIGYASTDLGGEEREVRVRETALANFIADAMRDALRADVALLNGGAVRGTIPVGPIRRSHVHNVLPFGGVAFGLELTGAVLLDALEHGVELFPHMSGRFLQVSGMAYAFDPERPPGERIVRAEVGGEPIDPGRVYRVVVSDFLASGGDDYPMFSDAPKYWDPHFEGGPSLHDLLTQYIRSVEAVEPAVEGRIRRAPVMVEGRSSR